MLTIFWVLLGTNQSLKWSIIDLAADMCAPDPILSAMNPPRAWSFCSTILEPKFLVFYSIYYFVSP